MLRQMNCHLLSYVLITCVLLHVPASSGKDCETQDNGCSCQFDDGSGTIDLTSLGNSDGTPRFKDVPYKKGGNGETISYNPCAGFSEGRCDNAAVCMKEHGSTQSIGDADSALLKYDDESGHLYAGYQSVDPAVTRVTQVKLICDKRACNPTFEPMDGGGQSDVIIQFFANLKTVCACPNMCSASGPTNCGKNGKGSSTGGLSVGTYVLIGLVTLTVLYLAIGTVYMKGVKKATGSDIIPLKNVWIGGFSLVKDGFKFVFSKCFPGKFSSHGQV